MTALVSYMLSMLFRSRSSPGESQECPLDLVAVPGLITLLDVALYRANEGQLTATVCSANALLCAWIDLNEQAQSLLKVLFREEESSSPRSQQVRRMAESSESFARLCCDAASDAIERISQDRLAQSANLANPNDYGTDSGSSATSSALLGVGSQGIAHGVLESIRAAETGRGRDKQTSLNAKDCWESPRLQCPDYVWADDILLSCQRLLRTLTKHAFYSDLFVDSFAAVSHHGTSAGSNINATTSAAVALSGLGPLCEREARLLAGLLKEDIPMRLHQFKCAVEADAVVSKRLYLVKCEYRAPFRAFLEAHQTVQRAPPIELVDEYIALQDQRDKLEAKRSKVNAFIQSTLETPSLVEALTLEQHCEELEVKMAEAIFPFTELARVLDSKRARLKPVPGVLLSEEIPCLQETLRRLKFLLCRKAGPETSTGIRPLLLDLQGVPREESLARSSSTYPFGSVSDNNMTTNQAIQKRLDSLMGQLQCLGKLCKNRGSFQPEKKGDVDIATWVIKGCYELDVELFCAHHQDWYDMVKRQRELAVEIGKQYESGNSASLNAFASLSENLRQAEIEMSIAVASGPALSMVRQRLEVIDNDRKKRFEVLAEMAEEVCVREMNIHVSLQPPEKDTVLELKETSALGVFGVALQIAGETLPLG